MIRIEGVESERRSQPFLPSERFARVSRPDDLGGLFPMKGPAEIRLPARPPHEVVELVDFLGKLNSRMREMRSTTALPKSAVTLPDRFDDVVSHFTEDMRRQAQQAMDQGEELVEVRLPQTEELVALAQWAEPKMELITGLTRAGVVQREWERPLKVMMEVFEATLAQIEDADR
jgi:hypothetical protein